jgi:hypothetical protein
LIAERRRADDLEIEHPRWTYYEDTMDGIVRERKAGPTASVVGLTFAVRHREGSIRKKQRALGGWGPIGIVRRCWFLDG